MSTTPAHSPGLTICGNTVRITTVSFASRPSQLISHYLQSRWTMSSGNSGEDRRRYPRAGVHVSIEIRTDATAAPWRVSTADISLCGCYVESMFTLEVGPKVLMTVWLNEQPIRTTAVVATRYPQLGNGFHFIDMSPQDRLKLGEFLIGMAGQQEKQ
jgi:PilZ domain